MPATSLASSGSLDSEGWVGSKKMDREFKSDQDGESDRGEINKSSFGESLQHFGCIEWFTRLLEIFLRIYMT